ncbi:MAG TPA: error-prone DNA polymerase [Alphaproteobacteria bacterium]|nr:error-prone DNA polymerase [Alphaproteobacteria bacterium]
MTPYTELQVTSNFSFLRGASHPEELVERAAELGYGALAVTDRNSLAGIVRAHAAARKAGLRLVVGARLDLEDGPSLLAYPSDRAAYGRLSTLLTRGKRRAKKGECRLTLADLLAHAEGQLVVALAPEEFGGDFERALDKLESALGDRLYLAAHHLYRGDDGARLQRLAELAGRLRISLVATNDVHAHAPARRALQDVLTCIREKCTIDEAGFRLFANAERHLKSPDEMARLFRHHAHAVPRTLEIVERTHFSLDELRYEYPVDPCPDGLTPQDYLARESWAGAAERYPSGIPGKVRAQLEHELALIGELGYAPYFLTVYDIVRFARREGILCQGRGSAANSAVCYCLGITAVDPSRLDLLFERFVSAERNEPPDIDVDFEHERREEVIQYVYAKYGRERAGIAATVICYRAKSAMREVGKAMGLSLDVAGALADTVWGWSEDGIDPQRVRELGLDPTEERLRTTLRLAAALVGFPRHLSQHVGGFVITRSPLSEVVPIENAAMPERTMIEWDKDDLDALGMLKIDVLALGMLSCISKSFALLSRHKGESLSLATVPPEEPAVYDMLCRADSIGVFQVESRAQMSFLPRMKPRDFYDLVVEVAIVRPGPIQGDMVHPYLRRRNGEEKVDYPSDELRQVLAKTLGVPLFQEQAMKIAIVAAGFTPSEADQLRRAMATFRKTGKINSFRVKMVEGMIARGYARDFAERCFHQIEGFGEYGFPESHAASFALLVYVSAWLKCRHPEIFAAALLNSQPMGFYAPAQIVRDAREHGVEVRPPDVNHSLWDCTLEAIGPAKKEQLSEARASPPPQPSPFKGEGEIIERANVSPPPLRGREREGGSSRAHESGYAGPFALRLGFRQVKGLREADIARLVARREGGYGDAAALQRRARLGSAALERLAEADTMGSLGLDRRAALWAVQALDEAPLPLFAAAARRTLAPEPEVTLPPAALGEEVAADYATLRLSLKTHPLALLRERLARDGVTPHAELATTAEGKRVTVAGLVLVRQRPGSARGVIFATLEDESGPANVIIWPDIFERFHRVVLASRLMAVTGRLQREGIVIHVIAERLADLSHYLRDLMNSPEGVRVAPPERQLYPSRDFH